MLKYIEIPHARVRDTLFPHISRCDTRRAARSPATTRKLFRFASRPQGEMTKALFFSLISLTGEQRSSMRATYPFVVPTFGRPPRDRYRDHTDGGLPPTRFIRRGLATPRHAIASNEL